MMEKNEKKKCNFKINEKDMDVIFDEYLRGKLSQEEEELMEEHIFVCDECFEELTFLENVKEAVNRIVKEGKEYIFFQNTANIKHLIDLPLFLRLKENKVIEKMAVNFRANDLKIKFELPIENEKVVAKDGKVNLIFKGKIENIKKSIPNLIIKIYSNLEKDYLNDVSIYDFKLDIADNLSFNKQITLELPKGLFYYICEKKDDDEPLSIGKFIVS